jgi:hypothetical protein
MMMNIVMVTIMMIVIVIGWMINPYGLLFINLINTTAAVGL